MRIRRCGPKPIVSLPYAHWGNSLQRLRAALSLVDARYIRAAPLRCPLCGPAVLVRLANDEAAVRCIRCGATPIAMSVASVLRTHAPALSTSSVYELSARGALHDFLQRTTKALMCSQYVPGAPLGSYVRGVRVEDVERLTFASHMFDICSSTEVFEHVADDRRAFREILRVLKPGGLLVFSVPIDVGADTYERAHVIDGSVVHLASPEYHRDPASRHEPVLAFRNYGRDIVDRLVDAGFSSVEIAQPREGPWFGFRRPVIVAAK